MKKLLILTFALFCFTTIPGRAAQTADARIYCLSIKFNRGTGPAWWSTLDLTGIQNGINGELYPVFGAPRTHYSSLVYRDETIGMSMPGQMLLDAPTALDENGNGFPDLFEVSEPFNGTSFGAFSLGFQNGSVTANWSRSAGSHTGTCQLTLQGLGTFTHTFEIIEYTGPLTYTPGETSVSGNVDLTRTGNPDDTLQGPVTFVKSSSDPYNELTLQAGAWVNEVEATFSFLSETYFRDLAWPTNYYGFIEFDDWNLSTAEADYYLWVLSIDDMNDADGDGIPDFSDDPQTALPRAPQLSLTRTATELLLTISGDVGSTCDILESDSVTATDWSIASTVTLESDPQTISLPMPSSGARFWRALAR